MSLTITLFTNNGVKQAYTLGYDGVTQLNKAHEAYIKVIFFNNQWLYIIHFNVQAIDCTFSLGVECPDDCVITLSVADVSKTFKQVNIHKAAGPDGLPRTCTQSMRGPTGKSLH